MKSIFLAALVLVGFQSISLGADSRDGFVFVLNQIKNCDFHQKGDRGPALNQWCVNKAVDTAIVVLNSFSSKSEKSIQVLHEIEHCPYYPIGLDSQPYVASCVHQKVDGAIEALH